ncbi:uncharacterized protein [Henckelia pumila]|uniref:uncharacterized protein isoform X3 n=1 Tax=Henckelia pumila TaxID=405737 RepID=UPI003C6E9282
MDCLSGFRPPNNTYSNTYNPGWKNHPNFSWSNQNQNLNQQNVVRPPPGFAQQDKKPSLEDLMTNFISSTETRLQNQDASIRNLETQLGQLANIIAGRTQGTLPSDTERNPKEQAKAITLKSGKEIGLETGKEDKNEHENEEREKGAWDWVSQSLLQCLYNWRIDPSHIHEELSRMF